MRDERSLWVGAEANIAFSSSNLTIHLDHRAWPTEKCQGEIIRKASLDTVRRPDAGALKASDQAWSSKSIS